MTLLDAAWAFRPRILADRECIEAGRRLPDDLARDLARAGFFRLSVPEDYGGLDLSPLEALEVYEELARADASVAWCVMNGNANWTTPQLSKDVAHSIFADPNVIVANSTRPSGKAVVVDGGYRMSGRWSLVSGCQMSTWLILMCIVYDNDRPRLTPAGTPESRFMLCPTADCEIIDTWTAGGLRGTGSHDVVARDLFIPALRGSFFTDPLVLGHPRYRLPASSRVISGLSVLALGIARGAIETLLGLAADKRHERTGQSMREDRGAQSRLAHAETLVGSARAFLFDTVGRLWDTVLAGREPTIGERAAVRMASCHAVNSGAQAVDLIYLTGGATSLYASCPLERAFRDVHAITQHIAVHPRVMETAGRVLFGLEPDVPTF